MPRTRTFYAPKTTVKRKDKWTEVLVELLGKNTANVTILLECWVAVKSLSVHERECALGMPLLFHIFRVVLQKYYYVV
jgi:hypothetical protein